LINWRGGGDGDAGIKREIGGDLVGKKEMRRIVNTLLRHDPGLEARNPAVYS
jgi:hypothetical protein